MKGYWKVLGLLVVTGTLITGYSLKAEKQTKQAKSLDHFDRVILSHSRDLVEDGREVFRFNTFGDESFWGDTLELHKPTASKTGTPERPSHLLLGASILVANRGDKRFTTSESLTDLSRIW
jgi:hypothetical protein